MKLSSISKGTVFLWMKRFQSPLFSKIFSYFTIPVAVTHSTNGSFSITKEQLQSHIFSNLLYFPKTGVASRRYHSNQLWYLLGFKHVWIEYTLLFEDINCNNPFALSINISREHLKGFIMSRGWFFNFFLIFDKRKLKNTIEYWKVKIDSGNEIQIIRVRSNHFDVSSIVNEAIGEVFNFYYFFYKIILHTKKNLKSKKVKKRLSFQTF